MVVMVDISLAVMMVNHGKTSSSDHSKRYVGDEPTQVQCLTTGYYDTGRSRSHLVYQHVSTRSASPSAPSWPSDVYLDPSSALRQAHQPVGQIHNHRCLIDTKSGHLLGMELVGTLLATWTRQCFGIPQPDCTAAQKEMPQPINSHHPGGEHQRARAWNRGSASSDFHLNLFSAPHGDRGGKHLVQPLVLIRIGWNKLKDISEYVLSCGNVQELRCDQGRKESWKSFMCLKVLLLIAGKYDWLLLSIIRTKYFLNGVSPASAAQSGSRGGLCQLCPARGSSPRCQRVRRLERPGAGGSGHWDRRLPGDTRPFQWLKYRGLVVQNHITK